MVSNSRIAFWALAIAFLMRESLHAMEAQSKHQDGLPSYSLQAAGVCGEEDESAECRPLLEEVFVTAQKREQNLQDIPMSIDVFSGADIESLGFHQPRDIAQYTAGVYVKPTVGNQNPVFTIRGIGFNDFTPIQNPAVAVYVNQVIVPFHPMMSFQLLDMERVEVLKGPQGTLYGRNATGGAINFITRKPGDELDGRFRLDVSDYSTYEFQGAVGGPLSETIGVRVALGSHQRNDSYQLNRVNDNDEFGSIDRVTGRALLSWAPGSGFDLLFGIHQGRDKSGPTANEHLASVDANTFQELCPSVAAGFRDEGPCINFGGYFDPDDDPYAGDYSVFNGGVDNKSEGLSLLANWRLSDRIALTSVTGFEKYDRKQIEDVDASPFVFLDVEINDKTESFTQEIRVASSAGQGADWILGAFYSIDSVLAIQDLDSSQFAGTHAIISNDQDSESYAAFADAEWGLSDHWQFNAGLRYTIDHKKWNGGSDLVGVASVMNAARISDSDLSGKISSEFKPNDDWMLYASLSKAYRSGGFPGSFTLDPAALQPFDKEKLYAFETGFKSSLFDGAIQLNSALYYYSWRGLQTQVTFADPLTGLPSLVLTNAGDAHVVGAEISLSWAITQSFVVRSGLNVQSGKIDDAVDPRLQDKQLANAPDVTFNLLARYEVPLRKGRLLLQGGTSYTDERFFTADNIPVFFGEDFWLLDARITYFSENDRWQFAAWMKNLTDEDYRVQGFNQFDFSGDSLFIYGEPRTMGLSVAYSF